MNKLYQFEAGSRCLADMHRLLRLPWFLIGARPQCWVDKRFYVFERDFYWANLSPSYRRVQDRLGYSLEAAFYDDLQRVEGVLVGLMKCLSFTAPQARLELPPRLSRSLSGTVQRFWRLSFYLHEQTS